MISERIALRSGLWIASFVFVISACLPTPASSQNPDSVRYRIYLTVRDSVTKRQALAALGFHPLATLGLDTLSGFTDHWYESDSPSLIEYPSPPVGNFFEELRINNVQQPFPQHGLLFGNIHPYPGPSGIDTFAISFSASDLFLYSHTQILSWPPVLGFYADSVRLKDRGNPPGSLVDVDMIKESTFTYRGESYHDTITDSYSVEPFNRGFLMIISHPKVPPGPPATVALVSPPNRSDNRPLNETLQWNGVPGAFFYKVQLDTSRTLANPISTDSMATNTRPLNGLLQTTWYYWRVLVGTPAGVSYYQDPPDSFRTLTVLPLPPAPPIISPAPGGTGVPNSPTFSWHAGSGQLTYQLQLSNSPNYTPLVHDTTLSDTSVVFSDSLLNCTSYYWRVRGWNSQDFGAFSSANFRIELGTPAVPVIIQYADNQTGVPLNATLVFAGRDSCSSLYRVQVALDSFFYQMVFNSTLTDTRFVLSDLLGLTTYYWRVRSENTDFQSAYAPTRSFTTIPDVRFRIWVTETDSGYSQKTSWPAYFGVHPKATFCIDSGLSGFSDHWFDELRVRNASPGCLEMWNWGRPVNIHQFRDVTQVDTFRLRWCPPDSISYHPQIFRWPSVIRYFCDSMKMTDQANLSNVDMLKDSSWTYYPDRDPIGISYVTITMWGPKVPPNPPTLVPLTSPPNGATERPLDETLTWDAVPGALFYHVQVSPDSLFSFLVVDDTVTATSVVLHGLNQSTTYCWRVCAWSEFGASYYQNPPNRFRTQQLLKVKDAGTGIPHEFRLYQNYPNPFNPSTNFRFSVPQSAHVRLTVFDILGEEIATIFEGDFAPGTYSGVWGGLNDRGSPLSSGIYYYRMVAGAFNDVKKMLIVR
ncbi:MAG: hypothetical protein AUI33_01415 [Ignavibacteria bacterium 13_1_40CM_2_61_4]|nr:MAG: hypothetical protein AUI33_01415 [Ignavibacteria bacterium 13_1_40CM_2_61_4]